MKTVFLSRSWSEPSFYGWSWSRYRYLLPGTGAEKKVSGAGAKENGSAPATLVVALGGLASDAVAMVGILWVLWGFLSVVWRWVPLLKMLLPLILQYCYYCCCYLSPCRFCCCESSYCWWCCCGSCCSQWCGSVWIIIRMRILDPEIPHTDPNSDLEVLHTDPREKVEILTFPHKI